MAYKTSIKPLGLSQNRLPLRFAIVVPSTDKEIEIDEKRFKLRVIKEKKFIDNTFGGDTSYIAEGSAKIKNVEGKFIREPVIKIESFTTPIKFENNRDKLINHIKNRQKKWKQVQIFYEIEGESFFYPKKSFIGNWNTKKEIFLS